MKRKLLMAALSLLMSAGLVTNAQPSLQWIKNYGGLNTDKAYSVKQLPDNGYIVVGESNSNNADVNGHHGPVDSTDYLVMRLDAAGNVVWQKSYGGSHNDIAISVDLTNDGGFIIAGSSDSQDGDVTDHPNGELQFDGGAGGDGGPVVIPAYPNVLTWVVKIDGAGNIDWTKTLPFSIFGPIGDGAIHATGYPVNYPGKIIRTSDGGYLLSLKKEVVPGEPNYAGFVSMFGSGYPLIPYLVKLNSNGDIAWANNFYPDLKTEDGVIKTLIETADGYVFISSPIFTGEVFIVKVSLSGVFQSARPFGGSGFNRAVAITATTDGGYIVTGTTDSEDGDLTGTTHHGGNDYWAIKFNSTLNVQWSKLYGGSQDDTPSSIIQQPDGNYVIAGSSSSDDQQVTGHAPSAAGQPANSDIWLIKINGSNGDLIWSASYGGNKDETGNDLVNTADGGLLVAGNSFSSFGNIVNKGDADWLLVKLNGACSTTPPASPADQHFCSNANPTVADLTATGQGIKWYDVPTGSRPLALTRTLNAAGAYYATQTVGGCESARQKVRVRVFATPGKPLASAQRFLCRNNPTVCDLRATGTALKWYGSSTSATPLPASAALHTGTYYVTQTVAGLCESERQAVCVTVVGRCGCGDTRMKKIGEEVDLTSATVYPNPNKGTFKLLLTTAGTDGKVTVTITDMYGKSVWQKDCRTVNGAVQETITAANLPAGMYMVRYTSNGETKAIKVIVER